jgi:hypothetical protein
VFAVVDDRLCVKQLGVLKKVGSTEWGCDKVDVVFMRRDSAQSYDTQ